MEAIRNIILYGDEKELQAVFLACFWLEFFE